MGILLRKSGILSTVQDLGRNGYRRFGINPGGVMDRTAARIVNLLLGNDDNEPVLEMHFPAPEIVFEEAIPFAIGGADLQPLLNGAPVANWRVHFARAGDVLQFSGKKRGNRSYLAVKGGFLVEGWLGSASTNLKAHIGGFEGRALRAGDRLVTKGSLETIRESHACAVSNRLLPLYRPFPTVRVTAGAEFELLTGESRQALLEENYVVTRESDRMGFRLSGEPLLLERPIELVSSAAAFGTVQLLPDGQIVILMADHQTSGGYPRIAGVVAIDLPLLAQLGPGDKVGFHLVSREQAEDLLLEFEEDMAILKAGCRFRWGV